MWVVTHLTELGDDLSPREGVRCIRDPGCDGWPERISIILAPDRDCHHGELAREVVERLEKRLGQSLEWSAWSHRDTAAPHVHLVIKAPMTRWIERAIERAAGEVYAGIRERQRGVCQAARDGS